MIQGPVIVDAQTLIELGGSGSKDVAWMSRFFYVGSGVASWRPTVDIRIRGINIAQKIQVCVSLNSTYTSSSPGAATQQFDDIILWNNETVSGIPGFVPVNRDVLSGIPIYVAVGSGGGVQLFYVPLSQINASTT